MPCTSSPCPLYLHRALNFLTVSCTSSPCPLYFLIVPCALYVPIVPFIFSRRFVHSYPVLFSLPVPCTSSLYPGVPHGALNFPTLSFSSPPCPVLSHHAPYTLTLPCTFLPCPELPHHALYFSTRVLYFLTVPCTSPLCPVLRRYVFFQYLCFNLMSSLAGLLFS